LTTRDQIVRPGEGLNVRFQQFDGRYIVRLEAGEPIVATLESFLRAQGADFASITAAGAVESIRLSYWDPDKRAYQGRDFPEQLEVVSFEGE
jgi:predicted DNA-binding protein with PD1-like motif